MAASSAGTPNSIVCSSRPQPLRHWHVDLHSLLKFIRPALDSPGDAHLLRARTLVLLQWRFATYRERHRILGTVQRQRIRPRERCEHWDPI